MIVGNKTDLHRERVVTTEEGKRLADTWKAAFYEVSAKSHEVSLPCAFQPFVILKRIITRLSVRYSIVS